MNKRNIRKKKRSDFPKNPIIERGTGNVGQILKLIGFRRNDPERLTANQIRALQTRNIDKLMAKKRRDNAQLSKDRKP